METLKVEVYEINELSEDAQEKAFEKWLMDFDYPWHEDNLKTLEEFQKVFPVNVTNFEYGGNNSFINWKFTGELDSLDLSGIRLATYIYNNFFDDIISPNFYSLWSKKDQNPYYKDKGNAPWGKLKKRYSKVLFNRYGCPFTGYCMDTDILLPIWEFLENPYYKDFETLLDECLQNWLSACNSDVESMMTFESFVEHCQCNDYKFLDNGELFY